MKVLNLLTFKTFKKSKVTVWIFRLYDGKHTLQLQANMVSGKRVIELDGEPILEIPPKFLDVGSSHRFYVSGFPCTLEIGSNGLTFNHKLWVDGKLIIPEK